jgi:MATE family multidrug resistance protein
MSIERKYTPGGFKEMLVIAVPIVISQSCDTLMVFTDRFFLAKLGAVQMNAAMAGGLSSYMMMCLFTGIIGYSTALIGQYYGAKRKDMCSRTTTQTFIFALLAYPAILLLKPLGYMLFDFMGLSAEQMVYQTIYFDILVFGSMVGLMRGVIYSYFSGIGRTRIIMISTILAMVVNIGINYVIIFGRFGFPAMGIRGAAYGTLIGGVSGLLVLVFAYFKKANREEFQIAQSFKFVPELMKKLLRFGTPPGIEQVINVIAFNAIVLIFQSHNDISAVAASITFSWDMVSYVPLIGIQIGVTSLVGRYMGARRVDLAEKSAMSGLKIGILFSSVIFVLFLFFPEMLVDVFQPKEYDAAFAQARSLSIFMIQVAAVYVSIEAVIVTFTGVLRGAGDTYFAMMLSTSMHWAMAIGIYVALNYANASAQTAWMISVGAFFLLGIAFYLRYRSGKWKEIEMVKSE